MNSQKKPRKNMNPSKGKEQFGEQWKSKSGCNKFDQLPQAVVMEILSRLSMKTLFTCRCVCKDWLSIISDPQFANLHQSTSSVGILIKTSWKHDLTHVLVCADDSGLRLETMRFTNNIPISEYRLINSCNGLFCLAGDSRYDPYYVCNPILGEFITIPPTRKVSWCTFVGFGFSVGTNEYKVLQTRLSDNYYDNEAEIYTIGKGGWRSIGNAPMDFPELSFNSYLRGALHWISYLGNMSKLVHTFNFETEQFRRLPSPTCFGHRKMQVSESFKLGVFGNCLILSIYNDDSSKIDMWLMKEYGVQESWTKILVIGNLYATKPKCSLYEPIMFLSNGDILMVYDRWDVVCYSTNINRFRETRITDTQWSFDAIAYTPSFVSPFHISIRQEVKRVRGSDKLLIEGSYNGAHSWMPPHKFHKT